MNSSKSRICSLDQFRGYTILGMLVVNYLGGYGLCPKLLKHSNDYCSYADTIMPQFFFAVGMALHLVSQSRRASGFYMRIVQRALLLTVIGFVLYFPWTKLAKEGAWASSGFWLGSLKRDLFQTLVHISVSTLWVLPVVRASNLTRALWGVASGVLHVFLSHQFYFVWVHESPGGIDGGPLGFLTWSLPVLAGMIAGSFLLPGFLGSNAYQGDSNNKRVLLGTARGFLACGILIMVIGYLFSCGTRFYDKDGSDLAATQKIAHSPVIPVVKNLVSPEGGSGGTKIENQSLRFRLAELPGFPPPGYESRAWNYWMMSQKAGTLSYQLFASGWSLMVFSGFLFVCDYLGYSSSILRTLGTNALACYVLHGFVIDFAAMLIGKDAPVWQVLIGLISTFGVVYGIVRCMERRNILWRV